MLSLKTILTFNLVIICIYLALFKYHNRLCWNIKEQFNEDIDKEKLQADMKKLLDSMNKNDRDTGDGTIELPYKFTKNYFLLGGFLMQWGKSDNDKNISYPIPFDQVFVGFATPNKSPGKENMRLEHIQKDTINFLAESSEKPFFWLALGLKITPISDD